MEIKILYNKKQQKFLFLYGMIMLTLGIISLLNNASSKSNFGIVIGIVSLLIFVVRHFGSYGIINSNQIIKGNLFKTVIKQNEIENIKMFAGDIEIYSKKNKIIFDKNQIDKLNLAEVEEYFRDKILK
jgi:hypothetical protein